MWYFIIGGVLGIVVLMFCVAVPFFPDNKNEDVKVREVLEGAGMGVCYGILTLMTWPLVVVFFGGWFVLETLVDRTNAKRKARRDGVVAVKSAEKPGIVGFFKGEK